jgi:hypothetical protein
MLAIEASSVEELNSRISQLTRETLKCAASDHTCDNEVHERERETLHHFCIFSFHPCAEAILIFYVSLQFPFPSLSEPLCEHHGI